MNNLTEQVNAGDNGTEVSSTKEVSDYTQKLIDKTRRVQHSVLSLRESLESSNFSSYNFNSVNKVSVKDPIAYNQEKSFLTEGKKTRQYVGDGVFEEVDTNDKVGICNESLKKMIVELLSKPIDKKNFSKTPEYKAFFNYLLKDILGHEVSDVSVQFKKGPAYSFYTCLDTIMEACARGATASTGIFDGKDSGPKASQNKDTWPKTFIERNKTKIPNVISSIAGQSISGYILADTDEEREAGIVFGRYAIKKYSPSMLATIYGITFVDAKDGFLDPYYNRSLSKIILNEEITEEEEASRLKEYRQGLITEQSAEGAPLNSSVVPSKEEKDAILKQTNAQLGKKETEDIKETMSAYSDYPKNAYFRNMLVWFYKLLSDDRKSLLPDSFYLIGNINQTLIEAKANDDNWMQNMKQMFQRKGALGFGGLSNEINKLEKNSESSVVGSEQQEKLKNKRLQLEAMDAEATLEKELEKITKELEDEIPRIRLSLMNGLFLSLGALALNEFDTPIYSSIKTGDLGTYVDYIEKIKSSYISDEGLSTIDLEMRRMFQWIDYHFDTSSSYDKINLPYETDKYSFQGKNQRLYLRAAENPKIYLMHSFYDMVMNDMRGRMARAFPTYYLLLIDEGRDLGVWRLQDNFYDVSSITEFQVVKSRKIAADTAKITMTNLLGTFTTEDDDMRDEYQYTFKDMFNSVFSPKVYTDKEYQRYAEARDINRAKMKPGARVSLRMGYSADASKLPIVFNGSVAEVQAGDLMTIICQGDGVELANPAMFNSTDAKDVADLEYNDSLISGFLGAFENITTPRDILLNPLIAEGNWVHTVIKNWSKGRLYNSNPFGITHFGDKHYKVIFSNNGEPEQNIYEALSKPSWGSDVAMDSNDYSYALPSAPKIKVGIQGNTSYWDLMHTAASVSPDFITSIIPFQMRSSVFYGAPRYYCAYDYDKLPNDQVVEKRKPFQQYHIYTSYTDILNNGITASDKEMRTCAVGIYQKPGVVIGSKSASVGPLFLDIDIYPENQKMTTINCNFEYKHFDLPITIPIVDTAVDAFSAAGGYQTAWRATANGLRETVKDMYTGELIVIGDPTVKPYDKIYINDLYEDMQGICDVETVVHSFSVEAGFTTSITPDCVSAIDNKYEQVATATLKEMLFPFLATHGALCATSMIFAKTVRSMFFAAQHSLDLGVNATQTAVNSISKVMGKDNIAQFSIFSDKLSSKLGYAFGVTPDDLAIYKSVNKIKTSFGALGQKKVITSSTDFVKFIESLSGLDETFKGMDPSDLYKNLDSIKDGRLEFPGVGASKDVKIDAAKESAKEMMENYKTVYEKSMKNIEISKDDITAILKSAKAKLDLTTKSDELIKSIDILEKSNGIKYVSSMDDVAKELNALKAVAAHVGDVSTDSAAAKLVAKLSTNVFDEAAIGLKSFDKVSDTFKEVNAIGKGARSMKAVAASNLLWAAAEIVITKNATEFIERKMKNWQVLTVFPMMQNGLPLSAGLNGSKGSVFGSPSYNKTGWLEQQSINFFEYKGNGPIGTSLAFLRDIFITTDEMKKTVNGYKRDNGYGKTSSSSDVERQSEISKLLAQVAKSNISGFNAYRELYFDARVESTTSSEANLAHRKYQLVDITENELLNTKVVSDNLVPVANNNNLIAKLQEKGVFKFVGDEDVAMETNLSNVSSDKYVMLHAVEGSSNGLKVPCKKIVSRNSDNTGTTLPVFVLPYLRPEAELVLNMVVEKICEEIEPDYKSETCEFTNLHKSNIVLHNGVMINTNSWMNTGFGFMLEVKSYDKFSNIIDKILANDKRISEAGDSKYKLLNIQKDTKLGGNVYAFYVSPKKV